MMGFPIPVRTVGTDNHVDDDELAYVSMPQGMETFRWPCLPEPEGIAGHDAAKAALQGVRKVLESTLADGVNRSIALQHLSPEDLRLVNSVLGEGEVSARVEGLAAGANVEIQETVFAGIWRVVLRADKFVLSDTVEVGSIPRVLEDAAAQDACEAMERWSGPLPHNVQNAPLLISEIADQFGRWQRGQDAYVINLTLLPMSMEDIGFMDHHLGTGRVLILSRGYGKCRITNCRVPHSWRVVYYNSQDMVILNTVEIGALPDVARAAREDLEDSNGRLREVLAWLENGA